MKIENPNLKWNGKLLPIVKKITKIVCHHPAHPSWDINDIHNYHRNSLGWVGIGYNYFITFDGRIFEGRGRNVGAHAQGYNSNTLGVCFQGDFEKQKMTDEQVKAGAWLIAQLLKNEGLSISDVIGHRDINATACPGRNFRMDDLKREILEILNPKVKQQPQKENDDKLKLKQWQWDMIVENLQAMYDNEIISDKNWIEKAKKKQLTISELAFLNNTIVTRRK